MADGNKNKYIRCVSQDKLLKPEYNNRPFMLPWQKIENKNNYQKYRVDEGKKKPEYIKDPRQLEWKIRQEERQNQQDTNTKLMLLAEVCSKRINEEKRNRFK